MLDLEVGKCVQVRACVG